MTDRTKTSGLLPRFIVRRADLSPHTLGSLSPRDGLCEDVYLASDVHQLLSPYSLSSNRLSSMAYSYVRTTFQTPPILPTSRPRCPVTP